MLVSIPRLSVLLAAAFSACLLLATSCTNPATAAVAPSMPPPSPRATMPSFEGQHALLATRVGLDADSLAAAGVTSGSVASIIATLITAEVNLPTPLAQLDEAYSSARAARNAAERKIHSGSATQQEIDAFAGLESALASAEAARNGALDSLFASATANLTSAQRASLTSIRAHRSWKLPTEFLVVARTEAEWIALRDALSNERTAAKNGDTPNATCQSLLATERAGASVAAAKAALDTNGSSVTSAWNAATSS